MPDLEALKVIADHMKQKAIEARRAYDAEHVRSLHDRLADAHSHAAISAAAGLDSSAYASAKQAVRELENVLERTFFAP